MLDPHGFVATCNSTHFFIVRGNQLWTSSGLYCLHGITRRHVIDLAAAKGYTVREKSFSLTEVYGADEAFVTGTFAGLIPANEPRLAIYCFVNEPNPKIDFYGGSVSAPVFAKVADR